MATPVPAASTPPVPVIRIPPAAPSGPVTPCGAGFTPDQCNTQSAYTSAIATEHIGKWTKVDAISDVIGGLGALGAAFFAFWAFRETRKQAKAAVEQADIARDQLNHAKEAFRAQDAASARAVRPKLLTTRFAVKINQDNPQILYDLLIEIAGDTPVRDVSVGYNIGFRNVVTGKVLMEAVGPPEMILAAPFIDANSYTEFEHLLDTSSMDIPDFHAPDIEMEVNTYLEWQDVRGWRIKEHRFYSSRVNANGSIGARSLKTVITEEVPPPSSDPTGN